MVVEELNTVKKSAQVIEDSEETPDVGMVKFLRSETGGNGYGGK